MYWSLEFRFRHNLKTTAILLLLSKSPTASVVEKKKSISDHNTFHCLTELTFYSKDYL